MSLRRFLVTSLAVASTATLMAFPAIASAGEGGSTVSAVDSVATHSASAATTAAASDSPTVDQYTNGGPPPPPVVHGGGGGNVAGLKATPLAASGGGGLPFTGMPLSWVFGFGLSLMLLGGGLHFYLRGRGGNKPA